MQPAGKGDFPFASNREASLPAPIPSATHHDSAAALKKKNDKESGCKMQAVTL